MDSVNVVNMLLATCLAITLVMLSRSIAESSNSAAESCSECNLCSEAVIGLERYAMYNRSVSPLVKINGLYFPEGYYCVWTEGRSLEEINRTDCHEVCHALISNDLDGFDKEHFCD